MKKNRQKTETKWNIVTLYIEWLNRNKKKTEWKWIRERIQRNIKYAINYRFAFVTNGSCSKDKFMIFRRISSKIKERIRKKRCKGVILLFIFLFFFFWNHIVHWFIRMSKVKHSSNREKVNNVVCLMIIIG